MPYLYPISKESGVMSRTGKSHHWTNRQKSATFQSMMMSTDFKRNHDYSFHVVELY